MIDSYKISVVIQGPVLGKDDFNKNHNITEKCINLVRKILPNSEIILSTWEGADISGINYDKLILNKDPGGVAFSNTKKLNNINRLIVSTKNGLAAASRDYCLKIRSDIGVLSADFLQYFDMFPLTSGKYQLFSHKILASSFFTLKYFSDCKNRMYTPFHVGDWIYFGLTEDLKTLYDVDIVEEPGYSQYLNNLNDKTNLNYNFFKGVYWRYPPEQYIFLTALRKKYPEIKFEHKLDYNKLNIEQSEQALINNFIILEPKKWKFICFKKDYYYMTNSMLLMDHKCWEGTYTFDNYSEDYIKNFDIAHKSKPGILYFILICSKLLPAWTKKLILRIFRNILILIIKINHIYSKK